MFCNFKFFSDPFLTQNRIGAGRAGWKQWKIRRVNGGKKHKSEPKWLYFFAETAYGPEGRGASCSAWESRSAATYLGLAVSSATTRISLGPAMESMLT